MLRSNVHHATGTYTASSVQFISMHLFFLCPPPPPRKLNKCTLNVMAESFLLNHISTTYAFQLYLVSGIGRFYLCNMQATDRFSLTYFPVQQIHK